MAVRAIHGGQVRRREYDGELECADPFAGRDFSNRRAEHRNGDRQSVYNGGEPLGARELRHRSRWGTAGAAVQFLEPARGLFVVAHAEFERIQAVLSPRADDQRRTRREPERHAPRGFGGLSSGHAAAWGSRLHAQFHRAERRTDQSRDDAAVECDTAAMTAAVGRFGGWAVGVAGVLLTAQPPNRLTAQT